MFNESKEGNDVSSSGHPKCGEQQEQTRICSPFPMAELPRDTHLTGHQRREASRPLRWLLGPLRRVLGQQKTTKKRARKSERKRVSVDSGHVVREARLAPPVCPDRASR